MERDTRELVRRLYERGARPSQLAEVLGVSRATIHNWVERPQASGRLAALSAGSR
ncbi:MAG: helix-turn-helix domain-containing protein [Thermoleophilaceae bacterium]|nr:helix-turn-helix domain-containing protein [Thermoleophilaceae bacterium]